MLEYLVDPDVSEEAAEDIDDFFEALDSLLSSGEIRMEIDDDGTPRFYPSS